jgi:transmembrane sensor
LEKAQLAELAERFLAGTATEKEKELLHEWYDTADKEEIELVFTREPETAEAVGKRLFSGLQLVMQEERQETRHRRIVFTRRWIAAASVIFVVVFAGKYFWDADRSSKTAPGVVQVTKPRTDLPPGTNKATLLLGDGSVIDLAEAKNGTIKHAAGALIEKKDSQLIYGFGAPEAAEMNTIQTPRGGQYEVVLADGTKVWLNSASSMSYPTTFTGNNRQVTLKGEAYFEVAEDKARPFKVSVGDVQVDVLGTHFDVMAYDDEDAINTTLLAGAIRVTTKGSASRVLAAGQQASVDRSSGSLIVKEADTEGAVAWKNGLFDFAGVSTESVMRQLARWYDVQVQYEGKADKHFRGTIPRSSNVSEVFKMLELTGEVHFSIDGKKITVKP